jgi:ubiquinone/menaquinone biosynthesis C-methylase UbiE
MLTLAAEIKGEHEAVWSAVLGALLKSLQQAGMQADLSPAGVIAQHGEVIGRVREHGSNRIVIDWRAAPWAGEAAASTMELSAEAQSDGTRVTFSHAGFEGVLGGEDLGAWFGSQLGAAFLQAAAPVQVGDWITDRKARRPWGGESRSVYGDPLFHYPNFRVILAELQLQQTDYLLEVGCGGGALLKDALGSGCRAAAIDHSTEMLDVARAANQAAIDERRLAVVAASADALPFAAERFTCAVMTGVLGFLAEPVRALSEVRRVLQGGGRFVALGSDPEMRGTPAAPEPFASRLRFYSEHELASIAKAAGFSRVEVVRRDLEQHARAVGVPAEFISLFAGKTTFLLARK